MILNSRVQRIIEEPTQEEILDSMLVKFFHKPVALLRAEVKAAEEYDLAQPREITDIWE